MHLNSLNIRSEILRLMPRSQPFCSSSFIFFSCLDLFALMLLFVAETSAFHREPYQVFSLILSWRKPLSYRNQSTDLLCKSMYWFLYDNGLRHERVNFNIVDNIWLCSSKRSSVFGSLISVILLIYIICVILKTIKYWWNYIIIT